MATAQRFGIFPATFQHAGGNLEVTQIRRTGVQPSTSYANFVPGGAVDPSAHLISHADPRMTFDTRDLATLLADVSLTAGLTFTSTCTLRYQERTDCGTFEAGATHETVTITGGCMFVDSISARQDDVEGATATVTVHPLWDGTTDPLVHNTGVNFAAASQPAFTSQFFLGPIYHNSVEIPGIISATFEPGIQFTVRRSSGDPYPRRGAIVARHPVFRITCLKMDEFAALDMFGRAITSSFAMYLWKGVNNGDRVAKANANHVKISCTAGLWNHEDVSVQAQDDATVTFIMRPTGTVSLSTTSAIP